MHAVPCDLAQFVKLGGMLLPRLYNLLTAFRYTKNVHLSQLVAFTSVKQAQTTHLYTYALVPAPCLVKETSAPLQATEQMA